MYLKRIFLVCSIFLGHIACADKAIDKQTVDTLDLPRYMGKWFQIARFDHRFEHNLVGSTVEYSFLPDGKIEVINCGYCNDFSGPCVKARGIASIPDASRPGRMKVTFLLKFYAEYNILEVDEVHYRYAMVGSNTPEYLWILSRSPRLAPDTIQLLLQKARQRGYDVNMLKWIKHEE